MNPPLLLPAKVQAGDELAKMLGESALLADLGPLLRMKQVGTAQVCQVGQVGQVCCSSSFYFKNSTNGGLSLIGWLVAYRDVICGCICPASFHGTGEGRAGSSGKTKRETLACRACRVGPGHSEATVLDGLEGLLGSALPLRLCGNMDVILPFLSPPGSVSLYPRISK